MSPFRAFKTSSTLPSIVLFALSALNLTVVFRYWRVQKSTLPADDYSLYCESRSFGFGWWWSSEHLMIFSVPGTRFPTALPR